ncbi:Maf family protein [bacterium]|nr:MAG: Maf family protein [bacterium]
MKLILGSESIFRKRLLERAGFEDFEVIAPRIDEKAIRDEDPKQLVLKLGIAKSMAVENNINSLKDHLGLDAREFIIITSDQVAVRERDGAILEKPLTKNNLPDKDMAVAYLRSYIDSPVIFYTSLVCYHVAKKLRTSQVVENWVEFLPFSESEIKKLVSWGSTYKACGALAGGIPGDPASEIVDSHIVGLSGDPTAVVGLPIAALKSYLRAIDFPVPRATFSPFTFGPMSHVKSRC